MSMGYSVLVLTLAPSLVAEKQHILTRNFRAKPTPDAVLIFDWGQGGRRHMLPGRFTVQSRCLDYKANTILPRG